MDLFAASGVDLGDGGKGGRNGRSALGRTLRVPLISYKVVRDELTRVHFAGTAEQIETAARYAKRARNPKFRKERETAIRNLFFDEILGTVLGYKKYDPEQPYTLAFERPIRRGAVDVALGRFPNRDGVDEIIAPFEMKGAAGKAVRRSGARCASRSSATRSFARN